MRGVVKRLAEAALLRGGPAAFSRRGLRHDTLVLAYHNILPHGAAPGRDGSLHLPQQSFADQLDIIMEHCDVIPLSQLYGVQDTIRPRIILTFDDAYQGTATAGLQEVRKRGLPATMFVPPAFIGGKSFWWDAIVEPGFSGLSPGFRDHALTALSGDDVTIREWVVAQGWPILDPELPCRAATEAELGVALLHDLLALAAHSWSHPNLTRVSTERLEHELRSPLQWLHESYTHVLDWISYPYGLSSPAIELAVADAGYAGAFRVSGGWISTGLGSERFRLPRYNVPAGISLDGFALRLAGMFCR